MKKWIKQQLRESLEETSIKPKGVYNYGTFHKLYHSNKYPDRLYKMGDDKTVEEWVSIFKYYPKYFPKVYRTFPSKTHQGITVVEIEKLNTTTAAKELKLIDTFLINASDIINCKNVSLLNFFEKECINDVLEAADYSDDPLMPQLIYKWGKFLKEVSPIIENALGRPLDLHIGNVAYDKFGKLKMIDI